MSRLSRRRFVQSSAATVAGLSAAPALLRAQGANDKIGVAVIGVNGRGNSHINGFLEDPRSEIVALVDVDSEVGNKRCDQVAEKQGMRPRLITDMREAFDDKSIDVCTSATPNHWHALSGIWAMQAGKDAYVEKPVCHNIAEGAALIATARRYERMCQVGTQCRSNPAIQEAMAFIANGGIGEVKLARGLCHKRRKSIGPKGDYPLPDQVDFNLWSGPAPYTDPKLTRQRFHYDWHWQRHYGNGDSGNQGPHQTDIARWGLGIDTHPTSVISYGGRLGYQHERKNPNYIDAGDTPNTQVSIYDYGDKCIVFETRGLDVNNSDDTEIERLFMDEKGEKNRGNKIGVVFYGTEGYLVQKKYTHCVAYDKNFKVIREFRGGGDHFANFLDACISRNTADLNADVREGHLSAGLSHLGNISLQLGENNHVSPEDARAILSDVKSYDDNAATLDSTIKHLTKNGVDLKKYPISLGPLLKFDPQKEVFPDNAEATALCSREYRDGFVCPKAADI